jgi:hypothetical protein
VQRCRDWEEEEVGTGRGSEKSAGQGDLDHRRWEKGDMDRMSHYWKMVVAARTDVVAATGGLARMGHKACMTGRGRGVQGMDTLGDGRQVELSSHCLVVAEDTDCCCMVGTGSCWIIQRVRRSDDRWSES